MEIHANKCDPWRVTVVDTGESSMTGGRLKRIQPYVGNETFCLSYGDGLSDVNINELIQFHYKQQTLATLTAVQPPGRFGALDIEQNQILNFLEKPQGDGGWINGGFFVLEPGIFDYIDGDTTIWEKEPLEQLAKQGQLSAFRHSGFWQCLDTQRDKDKLQDMWNKNDAKWKVWDDN